MERFVYNTAGMLFVLLFYVCFGFEVTALAILFLIYSDLRS